MAEAAQGTFEVELVPAASELGGAVSRFELRKQYHGDLEATATGMMLSGGDPASGAAGYVAIEAVRGTLRGRTGGFLMMQLGAMQDTSHYLDYRVVPGTGEGELAGLTGTLALHIEADGTHRFALAFEW